MNTSHKLQNRGYNSRESNEDAPYKRMKLNTRSASPRPFNPSDGKNNRNGDYFNGQDRRNPESWNHPKNNWRNEAHPMNRGEKSFGNGKKSSWANTGDPWGSAEVNNSGEKSFGNGKNNWGNTGGAWDSAEANNSGEKSFGNGKNSWGNSADTWSSAEVKDNEKGWGKQDKTSGILDKPRNNGGRNWGNYEQREKRLPQKEAHQQYDGRSRKDDGIFQQEREDGQKKFENSNGKLQRDNGRHHNGASTSPQNRYQHRESGQEKTSVAKKIRYDFPQQILIEYSFLSSPHKCIKPDSISKLINPQSRKEDLDEVMATISSSN